MTGSPVVMQGTNKMHGETIEILSKEDNRVIVSAVKAYSRADFSPPTRRTRPALAIP